MEVPIHLIQEDEKNASTRAQRLKKTTDFLRSSESVAEIDESSQIVDEDQMDVLSRAAAL